MDQIRNLNTNTMITATASFPRNTQKTDNAEITHGDCVSLNSSSNAEPKLSKPAIEQTEQKPTPEPAPEQHPLPKPPTPEKELTILFYMNGEYDDIAYQTANTLIGLESVGSTKDINVVAQLGRNPQKPKSEEELMGGIHVPIDNDWSGVRRYEVRQDSHPELNVGTFKDYLDLEEKIPENPFVHYVIGRQYWRQGKQELANKYFDRARELGVVDFMDNPQTDKSKAIRKEFNEHTRWMDEAIVDKKFIKSEMLQVMSPDVKMKDPAALQDFVKWGMEKYPSKHYMLVVMAHGGAWIGASEMTPKAMGDAITNGVKEHNEATGRNDKIDLLSLNCCYMGNLESVMEMRNASDVALVSENYATTGAFRDWPKFISHLQRTIDSGKPVDAKAFASEMVEYYRAEGKEVRDNFPDFAPYNRSYLTLTALDNKKLGDIMDAWKGFVTSCSENNVSDKDLFTAVKDAKHYASSAYNPRQVFGFYDNIRDIGSIMDNIIKGESFPEKVKDAAGQVKEALKSCIVNEQHMGIDMDGSHGLSVWGPTSYADYDVMAKDYPVYVPIVSKESGWMDRLNKASDNVPADVRQGFQDALGNIREIRKDLAKEGITDEEKKKLEEKLEAERDKALEFKKQGDFTLERQPNIYKSVPQQVYISEDAEMEAKDLREAAVRQTEMGRE